MMTSYIFGAHSRARTLAEYLRVTQPQMKLAAFLYNNDEENPEMIEGIPVIHLTGTMSWKDIAKSCGVWIDGEIEEKEDSNSTVYLAIRGIYHEKVTALLSCLGFTNIIPVTVELDTEIRTAYLRKRFEEGERPFIKIDDIESFPAGPDREDSSRGSELSGCIYEVRSIYDKVPEKDVYNRVPYEQSIQVGTALTDRHLEDCKYRDDEGDNISALNRRLCEETALYWIWKHASEEVLGLVHYRRHFFLPDDWIGRMNWNGIDVVLPIPLYVGPTIEENYRFRHVSTDWDVLMQVIREQSEEDYQFAQSFFMGNLYCPCNMFIMKKEVLQEYCAWLFPILFEVMERIGEREDVYQNRYPAFMAERLLSLYFEIKHERYRIVYADKGFLR